MANEIRIGSGTLHLDRIAELLQTPIAKGLYGGAGLGALMALLKNNALDKKVNDIYRDDKTDKDTMVLRIPRRAADKYAAAGCTPKRDGSRASTKELKKTSYRAEFRKGPAPKRNIADHEVADPRVTKKAAVPRQFQEALRVLAVLGAAGVGYKGVTALHDKIVDKRLKKDEEAARQAYLSALMPKRASDEMEKESALSAGGTMALLMLLLGGGSAYVTRDILNARRDRLAGKSYDPPPPINRIVFKSEDAADDDEGTELTQDQFKAAFVIKLAEVSGVGADIITDDMLQYCPEFQKVAQAATPGQTGGRQQFYDWIKGTAGHIANAMPGLTNSLIMAGVKRWPQLLKMIPSQERKLTDPKTWVSPYDAYMTAQKTMPAGYADNQIRSMLEGPQGAKYRAQAAGAATSAIGKGLSNFGNNTMTGLKGLFMDPKTAAFPGLSASIAGSYLATKLDDNDNEQAAPVALPRKRVRDTREIKRLIQGLELEGGDPDAEAYVEENRARIKAAIRKLMEQEQI